MKERRRVGNSKAEETERFRRQGGAKRAANGSFSSIKVCAYGLRRGGYHIILNAVYPIQVADTS
jgi:hypothetical protein